MKKEDTYKRLVCSIEKTEDDLKTILECSFYSVGPRS